jgi:SAM-dependent MidA family methyltransferase
MTNGPVRWRNAWQAALYAEDGFFRTSRPGDHFRTSAHVGAFAWAIAELVRRTDARRVHDVAAGGGELLRALHDLLPDVELIGVELAPRPDHLPSDIEWVAEPPQHMHDFFIANEGLDNVPCDVVELDAEGVVREVLVDPGTGEESLGKPYSVQWLDRWWPLTEPGQRAEVGLMRDGAWNDVVSRVRGTAIAIDYGHTRDDRPLFGTLRSYSGGREVDVVPDGTRDITAHVAVDSVAATVGATLIRQRDALRVLGLDTSRPPRELAHSDPSAYVRALSSAGEAGELMARGGLGDFWWLVTDTLGHGTLAS